VLWVLGACCRPVAVAAQYGLPPPPIPRMLLKAVDTEDCRNEAMRPSSALRRPAEDLPAPTRGAGACMGMGNIRMGHRYL
jgi:hypothetical protein